MTAQPTSRPEHPLLTVIEDAHEQAHRALDEGATLDAVVWLSAHLAATHRVLTPALRRLTREGSMRQRQRMIDLRLERLLRIAERRHSGDALAASLSENHLDNVLRVAISDHARAERAVLGQLVSTLPDEDLDALVSAYAQALQQAPTRPHPHAPHHGVLGAAAFRVDAWRDRLMNTMDSRHVPTPRVAHEPAHPGRWGRYLLGQMEP